MMNSKVCTSIVQRVFKEVHNSSFTNELTFELAGSAVKLFSTELNIYLVKEYLKYETNKNSASEWKIYSLINKYFWDDITNNLEIVFTPCLDFGDNGFIYEEDDYKIILCNSTRTIICTDNINKSIAIISNSIQGSFAYSYKAVRSILTHYLIEKGGFPFHSSAVDINGKTVLFCGQKGAGKSTSLLYALSSRIPNLKFMGNDRVILKNEKNNFNSYIWPTISGFGLNSLRLIPGLDKLITPQLHLDGGGISFLLLDLKYIEYSLSSMPDAATDKIRLTTIELEKLFGVKIASASKVNVIVEVELDLSLKKSELTIVDSSEQKKKILYNNLQNDIHSHINFLPNRCKITPTNFDNIDFSSILFLKLKAGPDHKDTIRGICSQLLHNELQVSPLPRWHYGVYGLVLNKAKTHFLAVKKTRGPYTNLYDLPGGSPEIREAREVSLVREFKEELGCLPKQESDFFDFQFHVQKDSNGSDINFIHCGTWCICKININELDHKTEEDVDGFEWINLSESGNSNLLSALSLHVLLTAKRLGYIE